jgi:hypothetical protein
VVPLALRGTRSVLRGGQWLPHRGAIRVEAGKPRRAERDDWRSAALLRENVRAEILASCGEPDLAAPATPIPWHVPQDAPGSAAGAHSFGRR